MQKPSISPRLAPGYLANARKIYDVNCQYRDVARQSYPPEVGTECTCMVAADTSALCDWAQNNNTIFNAAKSASMVISRSRDSAVGELHLDGDTIPCCETTNHLGVRLSSRLTWSAHIESLVSKTASSSGWLIVFICHAQLSVAATCHWFDQC